MLKRSFIGVDQSTTPAEGCGSVVAVSRRPLVKRRCAARGSTRMTGTGNHHRSTFCAPIPKPGATTIFVNLLGIDTCKRRSRDLAVGRAGRFRQEQCRRILLLPLRRRGDRTARLLGRGRGVRATHRRHAASCDAASEPSGAQSARAAFPASAACRVARKISSYRRHACPTGAVVIRRRVRRAAIFSVLGPAGAAGSVQANRGADPRISSGPAAIRAAPEGRTHDRADPGRTIILFPLRRRGRHTWPG